MRFQKSICYMFCFFENTLILCLFSNQNYILPTNIICFHVLLLGLNRSVSLRRSPTLSFSTRLVPALFFRPAASKQLHFTAAGLTNKNSRTKSLG